MPVAEITIKSKNGGYFYTKKNITDDTLKSVSDALIKNNTYKLELSPFEHVAFSDINIKVERGTMLEYCFYGINPDGIILGVDLFNEILNFSKPNDIEQQLKEINPNVNLDMLHLLQNITNHITSDDAENKAISFRNPMSPVNVEKIVGKINSLNTLPLLQKVKQQALEVCTNDVCIPEIKTQEILEIKAHRSIENIVQRIPENIIQEHQEIIIPIEQKVASNLNSPESRRSSTQSVTSDFNDLVISENIINKFGEIRHNISEAKSNLVEIETQNVSEKRGFGSILLKHTGELNGCLDDISVKLDNLGKQIELESKHQEHGKIGAKKVTHSRALLETRGILGKAGKVNYKLKN
jgi:hypothetical protein